MKKPAPKITRRGTAIYQGRKKIGEVRKFCCGFDFRPREEISSGLFSILGIHSIKEAALLKSIAAIMSIKIPKKFFHWNFSLEYIKDQDKLKEYEKRLNQKNK